MGFTIITKDGRIKIYVDDNHNHVITKIESCEINKISLKKVFSNNTPKERLYQINKEKTNLSTFKLKTDI